LGEIFKVCVPKSGIFSEPRVKFPLRRRLEVSVCLPFKKRGRRPDFSKKS